MKPSQVSSALQLLIERQRPCFIWGAPGVGKSDTVRQLATKMKLELRDVRLSLMDPVDLKGFPTPAKAGTKNVMSWLPPDFLPIKGKGVLFLDEMNSAPLSVQAAAYQLVLDRRIGNYELPPGWSVVAAGNRTTDRSVVHTMPAALANRFVHLDYDVDTDDWLDWATAHGVSFGTRGYIRYRPQNLVTNKIDAGMRAFPTPRSWYFADQVINSSVSSEVQLELLKGTIGEGAAVEYLGYMRESTKLPPIEKILMDPDNVEVPDSPSTKYAQIAALESSVTSTNFERMLRYVERMDKEFEVVFVTSSSRRDKKLTETKAFNKWLTANRSILLN